MSLKQKSYETHAYPYYRSLIHSGIFCVHGSALKKKKKLVQPTKLTLQPEVSYGSITVIFKFERASESPAELDKQSLLPTPERF